MVRRKNVFIQFFKGRRYLGATYTYMYSTPSDRRASAASIGIRYYNAIRITSGIRKRWQNFVYDVDDHGSNKMLIHPFHLTIK